MKRSQPVTISANNFAFLDFRHERFIGIHYAESPNVKNLLASYMVKVHNATMELSPTILTRSIFLRVNDFTNHLTPERVPLVHSLNLLGLVFRVPSFLIHGPAFGALTVRCCNVSA